jgi:flagellar protein FliJ
LQPTQERGSATDNQAVTGPAFRFRLERVRTVRERKEQLAQQELAAALARRTSTETELRAVEASLEHARAEQRSASSQGSAVSATEMLARQAFLERIETQRGVQERELLQRDTEVADRDARLASAASEHEMLNRLRERQRGEHDRELARREQGTIDEIAVTRFGRSVT